MKVILDTHIYISCLLTQGRGNTIGRVVDACLEHRQIKLIVPPELLEELAAKVVEKPYLRTNIYRQDLERLIASLSQFAENLTPISSFVPVSRDRNDDFLLAYGLVEDVDYLITGDDDLLSLGKVSNLEIVSATQFLHRLTANLA